MATVKRYIEVTEDIKLGYIYESKLFYVENKGLRVTRPYLTSPSADYPHGAIDLAEKISGTILEPEADIRAQIVTPLETLWHIYYTWSEDGSYIHTLQLNDQIGRAHV